MFFSLEVHSIFTIRYWLLFYICAMQQPWFKNWFNTPYYHQLYFKRDEKEAAAFIDKLIDYLKPAAGTTMLDVACGKGRHSIHLSEKGFDVRGIDLSEDSINEALQHETDTLHFYRHDMRLPFWINYFNYAFNFFTSFGYFNTRREHDDAIRTIAQAIKPGGIFVMDYLNVHYAEDHLMHKFDKEIDGVNFYITKWFDETHFYKKIVVEDETLEAPLEFTEKVAKFSLGDFTEMFAYQGLQLQEVFGDYSFCNYDVKKSPRMVMMAKKI
jgi:2-polyprenyl-3-methyl-5-hydroxy-6-metoxy-1,4-benzoquinol methylase